MPEGVQLFATPRSRGQAWEGVAKERWRMGPVPALSHSSFVHGPSPLPEWEDWGPGPYHRHHWIPVLTQCTHVAGLLDTFMALLYLFQRRSTRPHNSDSPASTKLIQTREENGLGQGHLGRASYLSACQAQPLADLPQSAASAAVSGVGSSDWAWFT